MIVADCQSGTSKLASTKSKEEEEIKNNKPRERCRPSAVAWRQEKAARLALVAAADMGGTSMLISVTTFWTILLIIHGLLAIALLGALTHQAMSVLLPVRQAAGSPGFVTR